METSLRNAAGTHWITTPPLTTITVYVVLPVDVYWLPFVCIGWFACHMVVSQVARQIDPNYPHFPPSRPSCPVAIQGHLQRQDRGAGASSCPRSLFDLAHSLTVLENVFSISKVLGSGGGGGS